MIHAQSVSAQLVKLGDLPSGTQGVGAQGVSTLPVLDWLQGELQHLDVEQRRDAEGNFWVTLHGMSERPVVLGSRLQAAGAQTVESHIGLVAGLETIRAMALREGGKPPCTLQLAVWAKPGAAQAEAAALRGQNTAAYLELHADLAAVEHAGTTLGVVGFAASEAPGVFNPRLMALCDEAVRELTGVSASLPLGTAGDAEAIGRAGVPAAAMAIVAPAAAGDVQVSIRRVFLLQAAEAFGRWAESTVHLVAGDPVDLWATEHRIPRG